MRSGRSPRLISLFADARNFLDQPLLMRRSLVDIKSQMMILLMAFFRLSFLRLVPSPDEKRAGFSKSFGGRVVVGATASFQEWVNGLDEFMAKVYVHYSCMCY